VSHWSAVKTQFKDLGSLKAAAAELGLNWLDGTTANVGYATLDKLVGTLNGQQRGHTIGVRKESDGTYSLHTDWMFGVDEIVGREYARLKQIYGVRTVEAKAKARGLTTKRIQVGGKINLEIGGLR